MTTRNTRLNEEDVKLIRQMWDEKRALFAEYLKINKFMLAEKFECSPALIAAVVTNKVWRV